MFFILEELRQVNRIDCLKSNDTSRETNCILKEKRLSQALNFGQITSGQYQLISGKEVWENSFRLLISIPHNKVLRTLKVKVKKEYVTQLLQFWREDYFVIVVSASLVTILQHLLLLFLLFYSFFAIYIFVITIYDEKSHDWPSIKFTEAHKEIQSKSNDPTL